MTADATRRELPIADELRHSRGHATGHHPLAGAGIIRAIVVVIRILVPKGLYQRRHPDRAVTAGGVIVGSQCPPRRYRCFVREPGRRDSRTDFSGILSKPFLQLHRNVLHIKVPFGGITQYRRDTVVGTDNHIAVTYIVDVQAVDRVSGFTRQSFIGLDQNRTGTSCILCTGPPPVEIGGHSHTGQSVHRSGYQNGNNCHKTNRQE